MENSTPPLYNRNPCKCNRGNITLLWHFCCPFLRRALSSNRCTDSYAEWLKQCVSAQRRSFLTSGRWVTSCGKIYPQPLLKGARIGSFKPKCRNIYIAISPVLLIRPATDFRTQLRPQTTLREWSAITPKANSTWLTAAILKIDVIS